MKKFLIASMVMMALVAQSFGAFKAPTPEQIAAAAKDPAAIKALLQDATPKQAAAVLKSVIASVAAQGLPPAQQTAAINAVIAAGFQAMPAQSVALAAQLGKAMRTDPVTAPLAPAVSAAIAVIAPASIGGAPLVVVVNAFNAAANLPPVASGYHAQRLK